MSDTVREIDRQLRSLLAQAREEVEALEAAEAERVKAFERYIAPLRQRVNALQAVLAAPESHGGQTLLPLASNGTGSDHRRVHPAWRGQGITPMSFPSEVWNRKLRNLGQLESLKVIAEHFGGEFRVVDARDILLRANKIKGDPANAYGHLLGLLKSSESFEKVARGTWRLRPEGYSGARTKDEQQEDAVSEFA